MWSVVRKTNRVAEIVQSSDTETLRPTFERTDTQLRKLRILRQRYKMTLILMAIMILNFSITKGNCLPEKASAFLRSASCISSSPLN